MIQNKSVSVFVFAKGLSTRFPNKNIKLLGGKPLFCHVLDSAILSKYADCVFIDSDNETILDIGKMHGATQLLRPKHLATNKATGDDLVYWEAQNCTTEFMVSINPCCPFIGPVIDTATEKLLFSGNSSVFTARRDVFYCWNNGVPDYYKNGKILNSYEKDPILYETTGLYANKTKDVLKHGKRVNMNNMFPLEVTKIQAIDINNIEDFNFASVVYKGML